MLKEAMYEDKQNSYATESGKSWTGVLNDVPDEFQDFLSEPTFSIEDITFCIWGKYTDSSWKVGRIDPRHHSSHVTQSCGRVMPGIGQQEVPLHILYDKLPS